MRRVTYLIDDKKGFSKTIDEERLKSIEGFKVYYTLEEKENEIYYCLEDIDGNKLSINDLNGYQNMYLYECMDCFRRNGEITNEYKDFIEILDVPREMKYLPNERYLMFKEYAKQNNIPDTTCEYMYFINKFASEYEITHQKSVLDNQSEFDKFLESKIVKNNHEKDKLKFDIKDTNFYKFFREELDRIIESYSEPGEYNLDKLTDKDLDIITEELLNDDYFNKIIDDYLQEALETHANTQVEEESL